jgi:hypothetical protein
MDISVQEPLPPGITALEDGSLEVDLNPAPTQAGPRPHDSNFAEDVDETKLNALGADLKRLIEEDDQSGEEWRQTFIRGLEELGLKIQDTSEPFEGACTAVHPLLLETIVKFQARVYGETLPPDGPCRTKVVGLASVQKDQQAKRVKDCINYYITERMTDYEDEHERLIFNQGFTGNGIKKIFYNAALDSPDQYQIPVDQFIVSYNSRHLTKSDRYTEVMFYTNDDLKTEVANGVYRDVGLLVPVQLSASPLRQAANRVQGIDAPVSWEGHRLYECHVKMVVEWDRQETVKGYAFPVPYIITLDAETGTIFAIRRNWTEGDRLFKKRDYYVHYKLVPSSGFWAYGYVHLIGGLAAASTTVMRALVDSGMFANLQGGFKARNFRIMGDANEPISPGEWRDVDSVGMDLTKSIMPLPFKEPSQTLFQLLQFMVAGGQKFADSTEQVISDSTNYGPVGTTLALLEASTKFHSAIHKRIYRAMKSELRLISDIIARYVEQYPYDEVGTLPEDFSTKVDVIPVADPNITSQAHRLTKATTVSQLAQSSPDLYDKREVHSRILAAMGEQEIEKLMPPPQQAKPLDPVSDLQAVLQGLPIKAFPGQDHESHIQIKMAFLQNPMAGANPTMSAQAPVVAANIREHMLLRLIERAQAMGAQDEQSMAMAMQQLTQMDVQQAQAQAQGQADPTMVLGLKDLEQRERERQDDQAFRAAQLAIRNRDLDIKEARNELDAHVQGAEVALKKAEQKQSAIEALAAETTKRLALQTKESIKS